MAQKKKKQRPPAQVQKAAEPVYADKMELKAQVLLAISVAVFVLAFVIMFSSSRYGYGTETYQWMQIIAYSGMALAGALIYWSSKYNKTRHQMNVKMVGIVFMMLGIGYVINLLIHF